MRTKQEKQELEQTISTLEGEIAGLRLRHRSWDRTQREALNILDIKGSMCFMLRVKFGYFFLSGNIIIKVSGLTFASPGTY